MTPKQIVLIVYGSYLILLSMITFFAYAKDKRKAIKGKQRTREKTLLTMSILGGAFGGLPSMIIFHHKTKLEHWYFTFCNILGILLHAGIFVAIYFLASF